MKKTISLAILMILMISLFSMALVMADGNGNQNQAGQDDEEEEDEEDDNGQGNQEKNKDQIKEQLQERNRLRFENRTGEECPDDCTCVGVVAKCELEDGGREMHVYTRSGNVIFQVKGVNASTTVELYKQN